MDSNLRGKWLQGPRTDGAVEVGRERDLVHPWALHERLEEAVGVRNAHRLNHILVCRKARAPACRIQPSILSCTNKMARPGALQCSVTHRQSIFENL